MLLVLTTVTDAYYNILQHYPSIKPLFYVSKCTQLAQLDIQGYFNVVLVSGTYIHAYTVCTLENDFRPKASTPSLKHDTNLFI